MKSEATSTGRLLVEARQGGKASLDTLLELYRRYLHWLARSRIGPQLRTRVNASDVVQEAMVQAWRNFDQFQGNDGKEFLAWLRRILVNCLARVVEQQVHARKRDVRREVSLDQAMSGAPASEATGAGALAGDDSTPSMQAQRHEMTAILAERLYQLPPQYRDVIVLRNLEGLPFEEVALRMGKTSGAVRILWLRALEHLKQKGHLEGLE
jgi:RNA polymerase sigma-70 factor (ECF subfamily)